MQGSPGSEAAAMAKEWIGVLFVHGIGDHRTYEHLENEAHQIVRALKEPAGKILGLSGRSEFGVRVRTSRDAPLHAEQGLWLGEKRAPVCVDLHDHHGAPERLIEIDFHEVWWADLNEPVNLGYHARFWSWGLGQWKVKRYTRTSLEGAEMRLPVFRETPEAKGSKLGRFCIDHPDFCERLQLWARRVPARAAQPCARQLRAQASHLRPHSGSGHPGPLHR
jgi:hypothetical protein